ncbi:MAG: hypothetical protein IM613_17120 [Cytophagales bacterium]|nr:hypothetical protein [Cytophagales bacterium]
MAKDKDKFVDQKKHPVLSLHIKRIHNRGFESVISVCKTNSYVFLKCSDSEKAQCCDVVIPKSQCSKSERHPQGMSDFRTDDFNKCSFSEPWTIDVAFPKTAKAGHFQPRYTSQECSFSENLKTLFAPRDNRIGWAYSLKNVAFPSRVETNGFGSRGDFRHHCINVTLKPIER